MVYLPVNLDKAPWALDFVSVPLPFSSTCFIWNQPQPGYLTRQMLAYFSALVWSWSWEQKCSLPCGEMKMMTSQHSWRKRGTENKEDVGSLEEQWTALNMKGMEHFYDHQGHFSKRGTSSCHVLKQVNARRQPGKSLLQWLAEHRSVHWDCLLWVCFLRGRTPPCCHYTNAMRIDFRAPKRPGVTQWISVQSAMGEITLPLWTWNLPSSTRDNLQM